MTATRFDRDAAVGVFVGLGRVVGNDADGVPRVQIMGGTGAVATAALALPYHYAAAKGDLLLLLGNRGRYWVTGVVHGQGRSQLAFVGNAILHATGNLRLRADAGVRVRGPQVEIRANTFEPCVTTMVQKVGELQSTTRDSLIERAGQCSRMIEGEDRQMAGRHETVALHKVKIDGDLLQLG